MKIRILLTLVVLILAGCERNDMEVVTSAERFDPVEARVRSGKANNLHSLVVWQNNQKVFELHKQGSGRVGDRHTPNVPVAIDELHNLHSITKSFVATLIFIAIDEGKLDSLDTPVFSLFPEYQHSDRDEKMQIKVRDVMNMSTGYALDELATSYSNTMASVFTRHYMASDLLEQFLSTRLASEPGANFSYSGLSTVGLSKIIERVYDKPFANVMREKLFQPLGITNYQWGTQHGSGEPGADWGLMLTPEDMGRFGLMWLNKGQFNGQQVVDAKWFDQLKKSAFPAYDMGYGLHFWQIPNIDGAVAAVGIGEQYIMMLPSKQAVIVATGGNYDEPSKPTFNTLKLLSQQL